MIDLLKLICEALRIMLSGKIRRIDDESELFRVSIYRVNTIIRIDLEPWNTGDPRWGENIRIMPVGKDTDR